MLRRTARIVALVGTLLIGIIAFALIVSQTPLFREWLRKFVVRQAGKYVNGTLTIGSLRGNLFYGIELGDIAIDVNGERVMTLKQVEIKYSVSESSCRRASPCAKSCCTSPTCCCVTTRRAGTLRRSFAGRRRRPTGRARANRCRCPPSRW